MPDVNIVIISGRDVDDLKQKVSSTKFGAKIDGVAAVWRRGRDGECGLTIVPLRPAYRKHEFCVVDFLLMTEFVKYVEAFLFVSYIKQNFVSYNTELVVYGGLYM
jgi:hypothetical protein